MEESSCLDTFLSIDARSISNSILILLIIFGFYTGSIGALGAYLTVKNESKSNYDIRIVRVQSFWQMYSKFVLEEYLTAHPGKIFILTDATLKEIYFDSQQFERELYEYDHRLTREKFLENVHVLQNPGEWNKCIATAEEIWTEMIASGYDRESTLIAFGGGVVGDLGGYVASGFLRGINLIHIPTSVIAMCDSAIGGKTGVDSKLGKNLIGSIYNPTMVVINTWFLETLNLRNLKNGLVEVVKMGAILDKELFELLEKDSTGKPLKISDLINNKDLLFKIMKLSIKNKVNVIQADLKEKKLRKILNFGHTIGHAIEAHENGNLLHGECVSIGIKKELELAVIKGLTSSKVAKRIIGVLENNIEISTEFKSHFDLEAIGKFLSSDKKNVSSQIHCVCIEEIGKARLDTFGSTLEEINKCLSFDYCIEKKYYEITKSPIQIKHQGSKSICNRALILAALSPSTIILKNISDCKDCRIMISALSTLGIHIEYLDSTSVKIVGCNGEFNNINNDKPIYLGNSGTSSRFLLTLTALLSKNSSVIFCADERLSSRPMVELIDTLKHHNMIEVEYLNKQNSFPLKISSLGNTKAVSSIKIDCSITSQFASSLLLCSPFLGSDEITIELEGNIVSDSYIHTTIAVMEKFGASISVNIPTITVKSNGYKEIEEYCIEGDFSTAAYDIAYSAIYGQPIELVNIPADSIQGEIKLLNILSTHFKGFKVQENGNLIIQGIPLNQTYETDIDEVSLLEGSDSFIALSIIIAVKLPKGTTFRITGIGNQRVKECNRIEKCVELLNSFRIISYELPDGIAIMSNPSIAEILPQHNLHSCACMELDDGNVCPHTRSKNCCKDVKEIQSILKMQLSSIFVPTYEDHRLAMAFTILGSIVPHHNRVIIQNGRTVEKTFPEFWNHIEENYGITYSGYVQNLKDDRTNFCGNQNLLILIGMRNSGKSMYSKYLCEHENFKEYCLDKIFEEKCSMSISSFVEKNGWQEFRKLETEIFFETLFKVYCDFDSYQHKEKVVISTGGGIVESPQNRDVLKSIKKNVLFIYRDPDDLTENFKDTIDSKSKPSYDNGESIEEVYKRRINYYKECSSNWFYVPPYSVMSGLFDDMEEYRQRLLQMFIDFIRDKWISAVRTILLPLG